MKLNLLALAAFILTSSARVRADAVKPDLKADAQTIFLLQAEAAKGTLADLAAHVQPVVSGGSIIEDPAMGPSKGLVRVMKHSSCEIAGRRIESPLRNEHIDALYYVMNRLLALRFTSAKLQAIEESLWKDCQNVAIRGPTPFTPFMKWR